MSAQQPLRVEVAKRGGCFSGCGSAIAIVIVFGMVITAVRDYWPYMLGALGVIAVAGTAWLLTRRESAPDIQAPPPPQEQPCPSCGQHLEGAVVRCRRCGTSLV